MRALGLVVLAACGASPPLDDVLRLNHLQAKGTHNSYHRLPKDIVIDEWRYEHQPLDVQLESQGVRHFELDVHQDDPAGPLLVRHLAFIDPESNCPLLEECYATVARWSTAHPLHHAIVIIVELRVPIDPLTIEAFFVELDRHARAAFGDALFTPDMLAGTSTSVRQVVLREGWPTLGALRGKVVVALNESGELRRLYTRDDRDLAGRAMFVTAEPEHPYAALIKRDDPSSPDISELVGRGFLVRTRTDSEGVEARANDRTKIELALKSGAQLISTDFPAKVEGLEYWLDIPGGTPSRCSPVGAPAACTSEAIESPDWLE